MTWAKLAGDFSAQPVARKVEQRFGLAGFARVVKILELLACSPDAVAGIVAMPASDWLDAMQCGRHELDEFLRFLQAAGWLSAEQAEPGVPLVVTVTNAAAFLPDAADPQLFTRSEQWRDWCSVELTFPAWLLDEPATARLFRIWCAVNVTTAEMQAAVNAAIDAKASLSPTALHEQINIIRRARLARAKG
jgi:hypothetical protein